MNFNRIKNFEAIEKWNVDQRLAPYSPQAHCSLLPVF